MILTDVLDRTVRMYPGKECLVWGDRRLTYSQFDERVNRLSNALLGLGLKKGDHVAVLAENCLEYVELYWALPIAGLVIVPLNFRLADRELEHQLNHSDARAIIVQDSYADTVDSLRPGLPSLRHFILVGDSIRDDYLPYEHLLAGGHVGRPPVNVLEDDMAYLMYTSGTTGHPKGAMLTHRNLIASTTSKMSWPEYIGPDVVGLATAPIFHAATAAAQRLHITIGAKLVVLGGFDAGQVLQTIEEERVTVFFAAPTMVIALLNHPDRQTRDLSSMRAIVVGAAPLPVEVLKLGMREFGRIFSQAYAMTETGPSGTFLPREDHILDGTPQQVRRLGSAGRAEIHMQVRVVDEAGRDVQTDEVGEVVIRGDSVMKGYWKMPEETAQVIRDGWYCTGDMGTVDEDGYLYIVDRKKDLIISGGENIYPREVEEVLFTHPAVLEAAVIGVPDDYWGESVKAFVVLKPGQTATEDELIALCKAKMASYKKPRSVEFIDQLPRNTSGKVLKTVLREKYWVGRNRKV